MKKHLFSFLILISLVFSVSAQKAKKPSKTEKNLRTHVSYLASEQLEGRRTGERGATSAAGYVANMFARYKLKGGYSNAANAKSKGSFLQPFEYVAGVELGENNSLKIEGKNLNLKTEWMPVSYSPDSEISGADVVFAGFGIESEKLGYTDYENINAANKIVLVLGGNPDAGNPHSEFALFGIHAKANIAKAKGAKGLIVVARDENFSDKKLAQMDFNQTLGILAVPTVIVSRQIAQKLLNTDAKGLQEIEKWMAMRKETPEPIQIKLADKIEAKADLEVTIVKRKAEAYNVIGIIEGRDPVLKNQAIIIGAHYDHLGMGGEGSLSPDTKDIHHGADDNASGTAALMELARQFRKAKKNKRTLIFIGFGGEESGLLGSKAYTNNPVFPLENTIAMLNMDMVGRLNEGKLTVGGIGTAEEWDRIVNQNQPLEIGKTSIENREISNVNKKNAPISIGINGNVMVSKSSDNKVFNLQLNQDGFGPSDHSSFYAKKIPVLFFFTGTHADYHKPSDTAEKINYKGLEQITGFVSEIVRAIDENLARPVYKVAESSNMMGGRRGFNVSLGTIPSYADSDNTGLVLDGVRNDSAADKAGIKGGDKIIKIAGKEIRNISDYMFMLGEMKPGEEYEVVVMRGTEKLVLKIVPDERK